MKIIAVLLCFFVLAFAFASDTIDIGDRHHDNDEHHGEGYTSEEARQTREIKDRWIKTFLKHYCKDAEGNYEVCQHCRAVACLQVMSHPTEFLRYDNCIEDHNRCCTKPGVSPGTAAGAGKCYATGWYSEVGKGQLSVIRAATGGQSRDAPSQYRGE